MFDSVRKYNIELETFAKTLRQKDVLTSCTRVVLHPTCVKRHFLAPVSDVEIPVEYARKYPSGVDGLINFVYFDKSQIVGTNGITKWSIFSP